MKLKTTVVFVLIFFSSCSTLKKISQTSDNNKSDKDLIHLIQGAQPKVTNANLSKMSWKISGQDATISGSCKIKVDSVIYVSFQPFLGFEAFKVELYPNNVLVFDKMSQNLYQIDYDFFYTNFGLQLNFKTLQSILLNQQCSFTSSNNLNEKFSIVSLPDNQKKIITNNANNKQSTTISKDYRILDIFVEEHNSSNNFQIKYSNFVEQQGVLFPRNINIEASKAKVQTAGAITIQKVEFNTPIHFTPTDVSRFKRQDINKLLIR